MLRTHQDAPWNERARMSVDLNKIMCVSHLVDGLQQGLSHFSGPSRAALIFAEKQTDPIRVFDPQDLLRGHEPKLRELFLESRHWRTEAPDTRELKSFGHIFPEKDLSLAGLISQGARTASIFYQMWFTDHHPDMCSTAPTEKWLEYAACLLSHEFAHGCEFYAGTSPYALREYATHAVRDHILDELNLILGWDTYIRVFPILDVVLGVSRTIEEGAWPRGRLVFLDANSIPEVDFLVRFPAMEQPSLSNFKHVRKLLLAVENSDRVLVADAKNILGIARGKLPHCRITAEFQGGHGFLRLAGKPVCSFSDGSYHSTNRRPNLVNLEEALLESSCESSCTHTLFKIASEIVQTATNQKHGCTLVLDLNDLPLAISRQQLEQPVNLQLDCFLDLAKSLSKVDGALHICRDCHLHGFACLLDGDRVPGEDRSRGARYNSALRFSSKHDKIIVIVVSADRPVSVIQGGVELSALCEWKPFETYCKDFPLLEEWVQD